MPKKTIHIVNKSKPESDSARPLVKKRGRPRKVVLDASAEDIEPEKLFVSLQIVSAIIEIIKLQDISNVEEIHKQLIDRGFNVTQYRLRKYLEASRIEKVTCEDGKRYYRSTKDLMQPSLGTRIFHLVLSIKYNESLILIKSVSGAAQLVAKIIDQNCDQLNVLGTVAGDDSVMVVPSVTGEIESIYRNLVTFLSKCEEI